MIKGADNLATTVMRRTLVQDLTTLWWGDAWVRLRRISWYGRRYLYYYIGVSCHFCPLITPYGFARQDLTAIPAKPQWLNTGWVPTAWGRMSCAPPVRSRTSLAVGIFTQVIVLGIGLPDWRDCRIRRRTG